VLKVLSPWGTSLTFFSDSFELSNFSVYRLGQCVTSILALTAICGWLEHTLWFYPSELGSIYLFSFTRGNIGAYFNLCAVHSILVFSIVCIHDKDGSVSEGWSSHLGIYHHQRLSSIASVLFLMNSIYVTVLIVCMSRTI